MSFFFPDQLECLPGAVADVTACTEAVLKPDFAAFGALGLGLVSGLGTFSVVFVALLATRLCHRPRCKPSESAALGAELCGGLQGEDTPFPEVSVLEQFLGQAQLHPKAEVARTVGVVSRSFSRQDLEAAVRSLAQLLQSGNDERENQGQSSLVAIFLEPGPRQVAAILGIWLAGKAWTPFDRQSPFHRVAEMLQLVKPFGVVCDETAFLDSHDAFHDSYDSLRVVCADPKDPRLVWTVWTDRSEALKPEPELKLLQLAEVAKAESVAQVIYTSGSTGMPKGVVYSHRRLAHSSHFFGELCAVSSGTKCLQRTAMIWSVFRHEIYPVLCKGGTIIFPQHAQGSFGKGDQPLHVAKVIESEAINLFVATPTVLELVLDASAALSSSALRSLQHVVCMGEPLPWRLAKSFYDKAPFTTKLLNFYGSTETENTTFEVPKPTAELWTTVAMDSFVPAGRPQPQTSVYLLDPSSTEEVTSGEICFGGVISSGYWNRPELTTQRFIEHPTHGRLYRTGDLGTWRKLSGTPVLQVLGRLDRQVKIRGARVELEEVEARVQEITLRNNGTESAVVAACGVDNHKVLVAVLGPVSIDAVRQDCEQRLPAFMVPSLFLQVAQLPRLANQKADLRAIEKLAEEGLQKLRASGTSGTSVEKVEMFTDSLGMMRRLTRAHMQEMQWLQNQLAFWMLVGLLGHFQLFDGAHGGDVAQRIQNSFGHNKDMVAFMMLLGVSDSREPPVLGVRDLLVLSVALLMTSLGPWLLSPSYGPLHHVFYSFSAMSSAYGLPWLRVRHDWFLYHYLFARLCLVGLTKVSAKYRGLCGAWQAVLVLCMACLIPDDVLWLWIPLEYRRSAWTRSAAIMTKSIRMCCFFLTGCYLLAFHTMKAMRAERNEALKESRSQGFHGLLRYAKRLKTEAAAARAWHEPSFAAVCGCGAGAFTVFLVLSVLTSQVPLGELGDFGGNVYQHGWKAIYVEGENIYTVSHAVSWHYMTHPSLFLYVVVYIGEMLLLVVPFFAVALMMACWQLCNCWHFKTMGSVCFGTYVLHPYHMVAPWTAWFQRPILSRITSGSFSLSANVLIVLLWNVSFCILFAQTAGAYFHNLLVAGTRKLSQVGKSCQGDGHPQANDAWIGSYASYGSSGRSQGP